MVGDCKRRRWSTESTEISVFGREIRVHFITHFSPLKTTVGVGEISSIVERAGWSVTIDWTCSSKRSVELHASTRTVESIWR
jgi:hypothetical protein